MRTRKSQIIQKFGNNSKVIHFFLNAARIVVSVQCVQHNVTYSCDDILCAGLPGFQGFKGQVGDSGPQGFTGGTGQPGQRGQVGNPGDAGAIGRRGFTGSTGRPGLAGLPGMSITFLCCLSTLTAVFIATAAAMCSLEHGLRTFTAVLRSTQPSTLRWTVK